MSMQCAHCGLEKNLPAKYIYFFHYQFFFSNNTCYWKVINLSERKMHTHLKFHFTRVDTNKFPQILLACNWSTSNSCGYWCSSNHRSTCVWKWKCLYISIPCFCFHKGHDYYFSKTFIFLFSNALYLDLQTDKQKNYSCKYSFVLAEFYGKYRKITSQFSHMFFLANLDQKS